MYKIKFEKNQKHRLKLVCEDRIVLDYIRQQFSVPNPSFRFQPHASKDITPISLLWTFPDGLALDIIKSLKNKFGNNIEIDITDVKDIIRPFSYTPEKIIQPENPEIVYRDYQEYGIRLGLKYGRGLYHWATASGKSASMYGLIKNIWHNQGFKSKVLITVPRTQLVHQLASDFINYGCAPEEITKFTSNSDYDLSRNIIISNMQFLNSRIDELNTNDIKILIIDEVHSQGVRNEGFKLHKKITTNVKYGFSGTIPTTELEKYWNIVGLCGMILSEKKSAELQDEGYIAKSKFISIKFQHTVSQPQPAEIIEDKFLYAKALYPLELNYIENCEYTNTFICKLLFNLKNNSIILFDHIEHGHALHTIMNKLNENGSKEVFYIDGSIDVGYREYIRGKLEEINNGILLANTACFSVGINIKNIHNIGFAFSSGKSATKIMQSIGRGLRIHENKENLLLIDFHHNYIYSTKHFIQRLKLYKENYNINSIKTNVVGVRPDLLCI